MRTAHLTEQELQDYVMIGPANQEMTTHVSGCARCQLQISAYQDIFRFIGEQGAPALEFSPAELLPDDLKREAAQEPNELWYLSALGFGAVIGLALVTFALWTQLQAIFSGSSPLAILIGSVFGIILLGTGMMELLNTHHRSLHLIRKKPGQLV